VLQNNFRIVINDKKEFKVIKKERKLGVMKIVVICLIIFICLLFVTYANCGLRNMGLGGKDYRIPRVDITGPPSMGSVGPGNYLRKINYGGRERFYEIHVPSSYNRSIPTPVVLVFHGGGGYPDAVRYQSGMDRVSDRHGFIVVYPAGTGISKDRLLTWNAIISSGYAMKNNVDDVGFTRAVLDDLGHYFNLDPKRVYATGLSNGAAMVYRLARELSNRIAAIAPISGQLPPAMSMGSRPISIIHFHGLDDRIAPFGGGQGAASKTMWNSVPNVISSWVAYDGLPPNPTKTFTRGAATCTIYGPGRNGVEVELCEIKGGGHTWPGGDTTIAEKRFGLGAVNRDINASELMWEFFQAHPMR
jgi:polyhydroxybutyrate depolymerase